jgi:oligopeptide/dipeptide ABC transporter ATP-binding protein
MNMDEILLEVKNLQVEFVTKAQTVRVVDGIDFRIEKGETIAIAGESGSGKSVVANSIMGLLQKPGKIVGGEILFKGENLITKTPKAMLKIRGREIAMIFQEPLASLNPVYTIGKQIYEALQLNGKSSRQKNMKKAVKLLKDLGIPSPEQRSREFPHQLSGGMRQRAMIAMALSRSPALLIADEPTTALDVTVQAQIIELLQVIKGRTGMAIVFITHDLGIISQIASKVVIVYAGQTLEKGLVKDVFAEPLHPYTQGLQNSIPNFDKTPKTLLPAIKGSPPESWNLPPGCLFSPRCSKAFEKCTSQRPPMIIKENGHGVRCWLYIKGRENKQ